MPSLIFKVNGILHKGYVVVALNLGKDTYEVYLLNSRKKEINMVDNVYCEDLGNIIDGLVERKQSTSDDEYLQMLKEDEALVI